MAALTAYGYRFVACPLWDSYLGEKGGMASIFGRHSRRFAPSVGHRTPNERGAAERSPCPKREMISIRIDITSDECEGALCSNAYGKHAPGG